MGCRADFNGAGSAWIGVSVEFKDFTPQLLGEIESRDLGTSIDFRGDIGLLRSPNLFAHWKMGDEIGDLPGRMLPFRSERISQSSRLERR